jgi:TRAP-type mannitol/chloroaromatic compound transport system permease small subunit
MTGSWLVCADRATAAIIGAGRWLVLPVSLLLFLQWPLREVVHGYSAQANDLAQWLFALYVSHLAADSFAQLYSPATRRRLARVAALLCLVPWSLFIVIEAWPSVAQSVGQLETFPDTYDPGYFIIRASTWLLALLVLLQALLDAARPREQR